MGIEQQGTPNSKEQIDTYVESTPDSGINAVNDWIDVAANSENTIINVLYNDESNDGPLNISGFVQPANGIVTDNGNGTFSYTPNPGYAGKDTFTYTVTDDAGNESSAMVEIYVIGSGSMPDDGNGNDEQPVNSEPDAKWDDAVTDENQPVVINVLENDKDPDGDPITITGFTQPQNGVVVRNDDGSFTYTPNPGFHGTDVFEYSVTDGVNDWGDTAKVTIEVRDINQAPNAQDDAGVTDKNTPVVIDVLANDSDPDGDALTVMSATANNGTVEINADGKLVYTPNDGFSGLDNITYTITDPSGEQASATVAVTVRNANEIPVAHGDSAEIVEDQSVIIDALANDSDPDGDALTITSFDQPVNGMVIQDASGNFVYRPNAGFSGTDSFTYTVSDGNGGTDTATVTITVKPAVPPEPLNTAPDADTDVAFIDQDQTSIIDVLANDSDADGDVLSVSQYSQPGHGSLVLNDDGTFSYQPDADFAGVDYFEYTIDDGNGGTDTARVYVCVHDTNQGPDADDDMALLTDNAPAVIDVLANDSDPDGDAIFISGFSDPMNGTVTLNADGTFNYTPKDGFSGLDSFTYTIMDNNGGSDTATVKIFVPQVNAAPVAADDNVSTQEDQPVVIDALNNDSDPDGDMLAVMSFDQPANGTVVQNADGTFSYTPNADFNGTDTFSYTVTDGNGGTSTATVQVVVAPANDGPVAMDDKASVDEDGSVKIDVLSNDSDLDGDSLSVTEVGQPANGSVSINADGSVSYTPAEDYNGSDSFTYTISDGNGGTATATVYVCVKPVNDAPVATDDNAETSEDAPVVIDVLSNDSDPDGDALSIDSFEQPANGTVVQNAGGTFSYTPNADFNGTDTFTYTVTDGNGGTSTATVQVVVASVNEAPDANKDKATTEEGESVVIDALANDTDPDGDALTIESFKQPKHGTVELNDDGTFTYTPDDGFSGRDKFYYTVSDGHGGTDQAKVYIKVEPGQPDNRAPDANKDRFEAESGEPVVLDVLANDTDPDGDTLTIESFKQPKHGTVELNDDGTFTYTADDGYCGKDYFTYTVSDGNGGTDRAKVYIKVEPGQPDNQAPAADDDSATTLANQAVVIDVLANDWDADGDVLSIDGFEQPEHGLVVQNPDGTLTYQPEAGFSGTDRFTYRVSDGEGGFDTAVVMVTVDDSGSGSPVCAKLVGDTEVNEGETASYRVVLDQPVDHDAWFQIRVSDGSANRVDEWAGDQDIMAGGYYDIRWGIGGEVIDVIYGKVPNGQYVSDGNRDMVGPVDQSADYSLVQDGCIIQGDTVWVKVPAGESSSTALDVATWREMVTVDRDANNAGDYYEGTEDLSVAIVGSENAGDIEVCDAQLDVNIYDTTSYAYVSPIAIDMNGDGVQTTALGATEGKFDLLNNGEAVESGWLSGDDAFLAVDANGNGEIDDRSELFGGQVGEGFAKLASYDSNNDGVVDANDERFDELKVWQDVNQNHQTDEGELMTLDEAGIASLSTGYSVLGEVDSAGNMHLEQGTVTMADGSQAAMSDVYFNMAPDANGELPSIDDLLADAGDSLAELLGEADQPASQPAPSSGEVAALDTQGASDALKQLADVYEQQPQDVDPLG